MGAISRSPGCWPGITDYMQKDCQTVYPHPSWRRKTWDCQRRLVPTGDYDSRRVDRASDRVSAEYLNSFAAVYVDGQKMGEMRLSVG